MTTTSTIKDAIGRSITHTEIVETKSADLSTALETLESDENITDLGFAKLDDLSPDDRGEFLDVWGSHLGQAFRIYIFKA